MTARLLGAVLGGLLVTAAAGCGGGAQHTSHVATITPPEAEWPPAVQSPKDAVTVKMALASANGAQLRVRAYLVGAPSPCPPCPPGSVCTPCPPPAATFSDDIPTASASASAQGTGTPLRAVGRAGALNARHVGKLFLLTGTFTARGAMGPELDVTDVSALGDP